MKKSTLLLRFGKNILLFGALFIILSIAMDWYRKPSAPPQFAEKVLYDLEQQPKIIAQLSHDKPMLLYFWGSWCHFCKYTSPAIQDLAEKGQPVLGVSLRSGNEADVKRYMTENGYRFATVNDPEGDFSRGWGIQATPTILIIKQGKIISHTTGFTSEWGLKLRLWLAEFS